MDLRIAVPLGLLVIFILGGLLHDRFKNQRSRIEAWSNLFKEQGLKGLRTALDVYEVLQFEGYIDWQVHDMRMWVNTGVFATDGRVFVTTNYSDLPFGLGERILVALSPTHRFMKGVLGQFTLIRSRTNGREPAANPYTIIDFVPA